jgi:hypothetical protein
VLLLAAFAATAAPNVPPSVSLTNPAQGAVFASGTNVTLGAAASDPDGTVSKVEFFIDGFKAGTDTNSPYSFVWNNVALGPHTLWAVATDNAGATNRSADVAVTATYSANGSNTLVSPRSHWRYLDNGSDQGTAWRAPAFDDFAWAENVAQFGYGDGDEATLVSFGGNTNNRYITTYFRKAFTVPDASVFTQLTVRLLRDDGAIVYLNGTQVVRSNMPNGNISYTTLASTAVSGAAETNFFSSLVNAANLVTGTNVLAVEVHQNAGNSPDLSFDLQLLGRVNTFVPAITRGPYLQSGTTNSVIVRWRTDAAVASRVNFGTNAANLSQSALNATPATEHALAITGLLPDTKYFYAIVSGTTTLAGGTNHFFVTSPPIGPARPTRVWVLGDSGTANANAQSVRNAYLNYAGTNGPADIWLMLGDNAYNTGTDSEYQAAVFNLYPTVLRNKVLWPAIGNHDTAQQQTITTFPYLDIFSLPQNGEAGGVPSGTERYYSFDHANIHFVCLDSMSSSRATNGAQANWLRSDLEATTQDWLVAFWHHPPYTKGSHNSDTETELIQMRQNFLPILESYGVDLVLGGHSHCYERSFLLNRHYGSSTALASTNLLDNGDGQEDGDGAYAKSGPEGAVYIVAGNGGQVSGGSLNHPAMFVSLNELGSVIIDVNGGRMDVQMLGTTTFRDHFTLLKPSPPAPPSIVTPPQPLTVAEGGTAAFTVTAAGDAPLSYQWRKDGNPLTGHTNASLTLTNAMPADAGGYSVVVTNFAGSVTSATALLTVLAPPAILVQPTGGVVGVGGTFTLSVTATGAPPLRHQWRLNGSALAQATNSTLALTNAQENQSGGYSVVVTNLVGGTTSLTAQVTVLAPPVLLSQPQSQVVTVGSNAVFSVTASGTPPLAYQWRFNGTNALAGATNSTLTVANVQDASAGGYSVVVMNGFSATSAVAVLTVNHPPVASGFALWRPLTAGAKFRADTPLGSDPDGDATVLWSVGPASAAGGSARIAGDWVIYTPPAGWTNADSFPYVLGDGRGGSAIGTVSVGIGAHDIAENFLAIPLSNGSVLLRFSGIPGRNYSIQFSNSLDPPAWQTLATRAANGLGTFEYTDSPPPGETRFYRSIHP